jgi:phosphorylase kinase gamma subunit
VAMTISRLKTLKNKPQVIQTIDLLENPYRFKLFRRVIDTAAFNIYGHWVKKGEQQNRAALFEIQPKCDLKSIHVSRIEIVNTT